MAQSHASPTIRIRLVLPLLALGAVGVAAAGCGSDSNDETLSKAQVIEQGGAICKAAEQRVSALPQLSTQHPFAKGTSHAERQRARNFLVGYAAALESSREGLQRLNAPAQDRRLLNGYLRDIGIVVEKLRAASKADPQQVEAKANHAFNLFYKASRQTSEYGFPKGVCGAGGNN